MDFLRYLILLILLTSTIALGQSRPENRVVSEATPQENIVQNALKSGVLSVDVTSEKGNYIPVRINFTHAQTGLRYVRELPEGRGEVSLPEGTHMIYLYVYLDGEPILVDIQEKTIKSTNSAFLLLHLKEPENSTESFWLDSDADLAFDHVEVKHGTDPKDPFSVPGRPLIPYNNKVFNPKIGWYRGELSAHSTYGRGRESVAKLIQRAEKSKLDFLAITDDNSMESVLDTEYSSKKLVLIPAMKWGNDVTGYALIYGPQTLPALPGSLPSAQAEALQIQREGGLFAIAHPCFPQAPWQWGLSFVSAVQVWRGPWRAAAPMSIEALHPDYLVKNKTRTGLDIVEEKGYIHSIAAAADAADRISALEVRAPGAENRSLSANAQGTLFWDFELKRGLIAAAIGGTGTDSPAVPMGEPVTYVYAREKSVAGILEGLRLGRTFISRGLDGPQIYFAADVQNNGTLDVGVGGIIPLHEEAAFEITVLNGKGKKVQLLENGIISTSKIIETNTFTYQAQKRPDFPVAYRVRVVGPPKNIREGYGQREVFAMTSAIYARDLNREHRKRQAIQQQGTYRQEALPMELDSRRR